MSTSVQCIELQIRQNNLNISHPETHTYTIHLRAFNYDEFSIKDEHSTVNRLQNSDLVFSFFSYKMDSISINR